MKTEIVDKRKVCAIVGGGKIDLVTANGESFAIFSDQKPFEMFIDRLAKVGVGNLRFYHL
jgi:hypothetical protein